VLIGAAAPHALAEFLQVRRLDGDQLGELGQGGVQALHPLHDQGQGVAGPVVGEEHAVAVKDQAAFRGQRLQLHAVALGCRAVGLVVADLQRVVARQQQAQQQQHPEHSHHGPGTVDELLAARIFQSHARCHQ
jgi:hypothetical protein